MSVWRSFPAALIRLLSLLMLLTAAALAGAGCAAPAAGPEEKETATDFTIVLYQGEGELGSPEVTLSDLQGKPVVLNFWAGLCPPCRVEMPEFQEFRDEFEGRVTLVGVDVGQFMRLGTREDARQLLAELGVTYASGYTDDANVIEDYRVLGLPTTLFINEKGELHRKWDGILNREKLTELAEEMLE